MKRIIVAILLAGLVAVMLSACGPYRGSRVVFSSNYGFSSWRGFPRYVDRRPIIVVPPESEDKEAVNLPVYPDTGAPEFEATPLPAEPDIDMGMPEAMDLGMPEAMDF